jgi:hypothetical protein
VGELAAEPMESLREEILRSEGVRSDLLKWKLALAGTLGAAGLGFFLLSGFSGLVITAVGNWQFAKRFEAVRALRSD